MFQRKENILVAKRSFQLILFIFLNCCSFQLIAQKGYFIPNALIEPNHNAAKQLSISLGVFRGVDFHTSYSINKHISFFGTVAVNKGVYTRRWLGDDEFRSQRNDNSFSVGASYFKLNNDLHFNHSIGLALSKTDNFRRYYSSDHGLTGKPASGGYQNVQTNTNYLGVFYQFSGFLMLDDFEIGLASRFTYNYFTNFSYYSPNNPNNIIREANFSIFNLEPVGILSYNFNKYKVSAQGGLSVGVPNNDIVFVNLIGRLSVQYSFDFNQNK